MPVTDRMHTCPGESAAKCPRTWYSPVTGTAGHRERDVSAVAGKCGVRHVHAGLDVVADQPPSVRSSSAPFSTQIAAVTTHAHTVVAVRLAWLPITDGREVRITSGTNANGMPNDSA